MKKFFPKTARTKFFHVTKNNKNLKPRHRNGLPEEGFNFKEEFDLLINETYTQLSVDERKILWTLTGSLLIKQDTQLAPRNRLTTALKMAQENLPNYTHD